MDFAFLDLSFVAEVIDCAEDQDADRNDVKAYLIVNASFDLQEVFDTQSGYQKVHGCPKEGQKGCLIGQNGTLQGEIFPQQQIFVDGFVGFGHAKERLRQQITYSRTALTKKVRLLRVGLSILAQILGINILGFARLEQCCWSGFLPKE